MKKRITLYHNARCSKSRATLDLIEKSGAECEIVDYLKTPPTPEVLDRLLTLLEMEPAQIVRDGEDKYTELGLDRSPPTHRSEWLRILSENPILIQRPIVTNGERAMIGRPPEKVLELLLK